uniref:Uncharacterized protein n=1 Tax=Globisporangium ultimum (strain ATCC 200006 / CBS 805.95 / DAOM BR144) TaxID=431595 RepID=K3XAW3_GLOUD
MWRIHGAYFSSERSEYRSSSLSRKRLSAFDVSEPLTFFVSSGFSGSGWPVSDAIQCLCQYSFSAFHRGSVPFTHV